MINTTPTVIQMISNDNTIADILIFVILITLKGNKLPPVVMEQNPTGPAVTLCLLNGKVGRGPPCLCNADGNLCNKTGLNSVTMLGVN